ncbi:unnamed protein product [Parnassius apollo]|uniref:(apollo) hypothetical protein n=1 Tax=Parnassius apollo TaxID=110799 RepID=A0A8S3XDL9_PARAO|nr:unnamed protein product [Parnassius apollo]
MTRSELEEFSDFIEKTSQLDLNLKSNPDLDVDEDETVSENAWEESGKFEGDLILNDRQRRLIVEDVAEGLARNGLRDITKRWPDNEVIYYIQREHFSEDQLQAIENGIDDITRASCIKFRPYKKGDRDAVVIQGSRRGCFSQVGYQGGYQVLNLYGRHPVGRGCFRHGTVVHEFLHTLGFYHMQSSPDRDDYIDVKWENIIQPARHNFRKYNTFAVSDFGVGYDYDSVLHYSKKAFSANGQDTLVPKQSGAYIGQRVGLSHKDTQKLNKMYCATDSNNNDIGNHVPQRIPNKKKKNKNKPFEGHGIGYHQGKAMVIKLPAAETYRLPDLPTFHTFDYFSKAPQAVSQTLAENREFKTRITSTYDLVTPVPDKVVEPVVFNTELPGNYNSSDVVFLTPPHHDDILEPIFKENNDTYGQRNQENVQKNLYEKEADGKDFEDAFERLNKVIKSHVYPAVGQSDYVTKNDYDNDYTPKDNFNVSDDDATMKTKEQYFSYTTNDRDIGLNEKSYDVEYPQKVTQENSQNKEFVEEIDSSFRTSFPRTSQDNIIQVTDSKSIKDNLNHRNDYEHLYIPNEHRENIRQHILFGENVPTNSEWNHNGKLKKTYW